MEKERAALLVRPTRPEDLDRILALYRIARDFMRRTGNPTQWKDSWPPDELAAEDIAQGRSMAVVSGETVVGVFAWYQGVDVDPTYREMAEGSWLEDSEYIVIHRAASSGEVPGVLRAVMDWAWARCPHIRVDTHTDNAVMRHLLGRMGFEYRGIIYVPQDTAPRLAFELLRPPALHV